MGVSPWNAYTSYAVSPEGTTGDSTPAIPAAPSGLCHRVCPRTMDSRPWLLPVVALRLEGQNGSSCLGGTEIDGTERLL